MASMKNTLTQERLKELLHYCPDTGVFTWLIKANNNGANIGDIAGGLDVNGYGRIKIARKIYKDRLFYPITPHVKSISNNKNGQRHTQIEMPNKDVRYMTQPSRKDCLFYYLGFIYDCKYFAAF